MNAVKYTSFQFYYIFYIYCFKLKSNLPCMFVAITFSNSHCLAGDKMD